MRHGKKFKQLSRKEGHRKALLRNMSISLIMEKRIFTTLAKAKALRRHIEPLITKSKKNTMHSRRVVFSYLQNKEAVSELFSTVAEKIGNRPGGYTRVIRTGSRKGDAAEMAMIELVDFNELYTAKKKKKKRTRRSGGSSSGAAKTAAGTSAVRSSEEE